MSTFFLFSSGMPGGMAWLVDVTVQATVVLLAAWALASLPPGLSAARRHAVLLTALLAIPVLMVMGWLAPGWLWMREAPVQMAPVARTSPASSDYRTVVSASQPGTAAQVPEKANAGAAATRSASASPSQSGRGEFAWASTLMILWLGGVLVGLAGVCHAGWRLRRLRRHCTVPVPPHVQAVFDEELARTLSHGSRRHHVILCCSEEPVMPMTWGWRRQWMLLPSQAEAWSADRLRLVCRHELAHVQRGDTRTAPLAFASALLLWFHPLAWLILRAAARNREAACDDLVLARSGAPHGPAYADALLRTVVELGTSPRPSFWAPALGVAMASARSRQLQSRLRDILDEGRPREPVTRRLRWARITAALAALPLLGGLSACREKEAPASGKPAAASTPAAPGNGKAYTYLLTDQQWKHLTSSFDGPRKSPAPVDPFSKGAPPAAVPADPSQRAELDLARTALHIRSVLLEWGVKFAPPEGTEPVSLKDSRTLVAWADEANQARLSEVLARHAEAQMIEISGRVFTAPMSPEIIASLGVNVPPDHQGILRSVLSEAEGLQLLQQMSQKKGFDLMSAPVLHTTSGQRSTVEVVREIIYPTEFDPAHIPAPTADAAKKPAASPAPASSPDANPAAGPAPVKPAGSEHLHVPVIPTTPTAFEMRPVGVRMEFDAFLASQDTIRLQLAPEVTWLEGFTNYGLPIRTLVPGRNGGVEEVTLSENVIKQPVFFTAKHTASASLKSGQWLLLGGFGLPENVSKPYAPQTKDTGVDALTLPSVMETRKSLFFLIQVRAK